MEDIQEKNRLIAEFMGYAVDNNGYHKNGEYVDNKGSKHYTGLTIKEVKYHTSWDWLMPVVEKIETIEIPDYYLPECYFIVTIEPGYCVISENGEAPMVEYQDQESPKISIVYEAVIEFIEWYNTNKK